MISRKRSQNLSDTTDNDDPFRREFTNNPSYLAKNPTRTRKRANHEIEFIGVDGEGITLEDGRHLYVLLSVGDQSLHKNGEELRFIEICRFLWQQFLDHPNAVFVGFYLAYDFTHWFKHLPEERARRLLTKEGIAKRTRSLGRNPFPFPVEYLDVAFDIMENFKRFRLTFDPPGKNRRWMYICDAGAFFQTSLMTVIDPANWPEPVCSDEEYRVISEGKLRRAVAEFDEEMITYNVLENDVLARIMEILNKGFVELGVELNRTQWYGPGQAAQEYLRLIKAQQREIADAWPDEIKIAAISSYFAGWFELFAHGIIPGLSYEYDVNSAYPTILSELPCLEHGEWKAPTGDPDEIVLIYATVYGSHSKIGAMLHRTPDGHVLRPSVTRGWYWKHEIEAAQNIGAIDEVDIEDSIAWKSSCNHKPFGFLRTLYEMRLRVGKNTPLGKALKLIYNSIYGKITQSVGNPQFANPVYASLITAGCRTMMLKAIASHPEGPNALLMVATDAVYFSSPHPGLPLSEKLGEWSSKEHSNLTLVLPGLYYNDVSRNGARDLARGKQTKVKMRARGFSSQDFATTLGKWDRKFKAANAFLRKNGPLLEDTGTLPVIRRHYWPAVSIPVSFSIVSARMALHNNNWSSCGAMSSEPFRGSDSWPGTKRDPHSQHLDERGIRWTRPYQESADGIISTPYDEKFGLELEYKKELNEYISDMQTLTFDMYDRMIGDRIENV